MTQIVTGNIGRKVMTLERSNKPILAIYSKRKEIKLVKGGGIISVIQAYWGSLGVQSRASRLSNEGTK